jgi:hypothetical protein
VPKAVEDTIIFAYAGGLLALSVVLWLVSRAIAGPAQPVDPAALVDQPSSRASRLICGTAPSVLEIRQFSFADLAVSWKAASSMPGTRATVTRSIFVIAKPSSCFRIWTFASVLTDSAVLPPCASWWASYME